MRAAATPSAVVCSPWGDNYVRASRTGIRYTRSPQYVRYLLGAAWNLKLQQLRLEGVSLFRRSFVHLHYPGQDSFRRPPLALHEPFTYLLVLGIALGIHF